MKKDPAKQNSPSKAPSRAPKGTLLDFTVSSLDAEGYGLATHENRQVLISGALPGELVRARITHVGARTYFAETVSVLRRSPHRLTSPPCPRPPECDGCPLIALQYPAQLAWKRSLVSDALARYHSLAGTECADVIPSPERLGYRNSAKLVVSGKFTAPVIGIYRRNSHDVVDISACPLHHPLINRVIAAAKEGIRKGKIPVYSPRSGSGLLRYLVVRVVPEDNRVMVVFVTTERAYNAIHHLVKTVRTAVPEVTVVVENINTTTGNTILGTRNNFLTTEQTLTATIGPVRFTLSPRSFFQVNSGAAGIIYETVRQWANLTGQERVVDLYCGVGGLALFLAEKAREIIGIEVIEAATTDAEENARLNGRDNCRFITGDVSTHLGMLRSNRQPVDLITLNPPRKGCDEAVLRDAAALAPARMIYVSCSPESLARDLEILSNHGYRTVRVQPVDMFPQTTHVENVALLERI
jgi:23S rRNA (uracil1939-C5)-methyltransferase